MKTYGQLAFVYDRLMDHIDFSAFVAFVLAAAQRFGWKGQHILDLACGTGNITLELLKKGYDVWGLDISEDMLAVADEKLFRCGFNPRLICQDMRDLEVPGEFELITCAFDSLNYLVEEEDLNSVFGNVFKTLSSQGFFLFDLNSLYKFENILGEETYTFVDDDICYIWQNYYDSEEQIADIQLDIFVKKQGAEYIRFQEYHQERYFSIEMVKRLLKQNNLELLAVYGDQEFIAPKVNTERLFFVTQKKSDGFSI